MLAITFEDAAFERSTLRDEYDLLLGVVATLTVSVASRIVYSEPMFPIVELRVAFDRWLRSPSCELSDFEFESMESDDVGLVWVRRQPSGAWRAGSVHQDDLALDEMGFEDVAHARRVFIEAVDSWTRDHLGVEVRDVVEI
jgi:hypothetical protein